MRALSAVVAGAGAPALGAVPMERNARHRGLPIRVGVAFAASELDGDAVERLLPVAAQLEAHGADGLWLGVGASPARPASAAALALVRHTRRIPLHVGVAPAGARAAGRELAEVAGPDGARLDRVLVMSDEDAGVEAWSTEATTDVGGWFAGGPGAAQAAGSMGRGWLATGLDPQGVVRAVQSAQDAAASAGHELSAAGTGVLLGSGLRSGDLLDGEPGATNATSLRVLVERHIAVGVSYVVLRPATSELQRWVDEVCAPLIHEIAEEGHAPCGC
ncbi:MAG: hypothetical protein QOJ82_922 [Solirubrobacteraceae bacterium]|nr:hypothetical protein [Solirubrobacteraceae bacterium]